MVALLSGPTPSCWLYTYLVVADGLIKRRFPSPFSTTHASRDLLLHMDGGEGHNYACVTVIEDPPQDPLRIYLSLYSNSRRILRGSSGDPQGILYGVTPSLLSAWGRE